MRVLFLLAAFLCLPSTVLAQVETVYPERVTAPAELRERLKQYRIAIPLQVTARRGEDGNPKLISLPRSTSTVPYQQVIASTSPEIQALIEYETALFALRIRPSTTQSKSVPAIPEGIRNAPVPCEPAEWELPDFLDRIAASTKVGWTVKEENGKLRVEFVRLQGTPRPETFLPDWQWLHAIPDNPQLYPEKVTVPEPVRKRLEGIRVNVNLVDRNGVGALTSLLDARVDHQFDPALQFSVEKRVPRWNLLMDDILALQKRDPEWLYPGLRLQKVTIKANGVALPTALDMLTQSLGVGWTAEPSGERTLVRIVRLRSTPSPPKALQSSLDAIRTLAAQLPREANPLVQLPPSAYLKEMVSLELESGTLRTALETLLRSTKRRFELSPDASTLKRSFRFESVSLSSALSLICDSYNVIWSLERDSQDSAFLSIRKRGEAPPQK